MAVTKQDLEGALSKAQANHDYAEVVKLQGYLRDFDARQMQQNIRPQDQAMESAEIQTSEGVSPIESIGRGLWQDVTMGFSDELAGVTDALISGNLNMEDFQKSYYEGRDESRRLNELAQMENPKSYMAGSVAGMIAPAVASLAFGGIGLPALLGRKAAQTAAKEAVKRTAQKGILGAGQTIMKSAGKGALSGAVSGGIYGAGVAEEMDDVQRSVGQGALVGGTLGGVLGGATGAFSAGRNYLSNNLKNISAKRAKGATKGTELTKMLKTADTAELIEEYGGKKFNIKRPRSKDILDTLDEYGAMKFGGESAEVEAKLAVDRGILGERLGMLRQQAAKELGEAGVTPVNKIVKEVMPSGLNKNEQRMIKNYFKTVAPEDIGTIKKVQGPKGAPKNIKTYDVADLHKVATDLRDRSGFIKKSTIGKEKHKKNIYDKLLQGVEAVIEDKTKPVSKGLKGALSKETMNFKKILASQDAIAPIAMEDALAAQGGQALKLTELRGLTSALGFRSILGTKSAIELPLAKAFSKRGADVKALESAGRILTRGLREFPLRNTLSNQARSY